MRWISCAFNTSDEWVRPFRVDYTEMITLQVPCTKLPWRPRIATALRRCPKLSSFSLLDQVRHIFLSYLHSLLLVLKRREKKWKVELRRELLATIWALSKHGCRKATLWIATKSNQLTLLIYLHFNLIISTKFHISRCPPINLSGINGADSRWNAIKLTWNMSNSSPVSCHSNSVFLQSLITANFFRIHPQRQELGS